MCALYKGASEGRTGVYSRLGKVLIVELCTAVAGAEQQGRNCLCRIKPACRHS